MLTAESIQKRFPTRTGDLVVLRDVSLELRAGESAAIMGPSGCGKSTLMNILGTLEPPTSGSVRLDGCNPFALAETDLARFRNSRVGFVFQDHHLLPQCSVLENVLLPTLATRKRERRPAGQPNISRLAQADDRDHVIRARALLDRVGLSARLDHRPAELSGGERQRVALARAVMNSPAMILADEPTGNLDRATAGHVVDMLLELHHDSDGVLIAVTHSMEVAERFARRFELIDGTLTPG